MPLNGAIKVIARACLSSRLSSPDNQMTIKSSATHLLRVASRAFSTTGSLEMRFVQFVNKNGGPQHLGIQLRPGGDITDVSAVDSRIPNNLKKFLEGGDDLLKKVKRNENFDFMDAVKRLVLPLKI